MPYRPTLPAIPSPTLPGDNPDREIDCEMYLEPAFQALAEGLSPPAGPRTVDSALIGLARAQITMRVENAKTDAMIEREKRKRRN